MLKKREGKRLAADTYVNKTKDIDLVGGKWYVNTLSTSTSHVFLLSLESVM